MILLLSVVCFVKSPGCVTGALPFGRQSSSMCAPFAGTRRKDAPLHLAAGSDRRAGSRFAITCGAVACHDVTRAIAAIA